MPNPITERRQESHPQDTVSERSDADKPPIAVDTFPANTLFALFDTRAAAEAAAGRVREAGVEDRDLEVYAGRSGASGLEPGDENASIFDRIVELAQELSDFNTFVRDCSAAVAKGKALLLVRFQDEAGRTAAEGITRQAGGAPLAYTGSWTLVKFH